MKGTRGTSPFANEYPFSDCQYILFKSPNHPQWSSQMRQLNSGSQTPLNYTFCLNPLIFRLWVLKAHQRYLVPWAPFFLNPRPPAHSFLPLISCGTEKGRQREMVISAPVCDFFVGERNFPCVFPKREKEISALEALAPIPCSIPPHLISPSLLFPMCLAG